ncbi:PAS domain-containing sensor histidine kinase [Rhodohalobacter sp. 8-1]|uniref:PAS domain-containing sensor histidine kinase n=1 Tax=Rhodohalobacter sp. 8-1 TaxID=3131972 RepID=UPI0030ECD07A
MTMNYLENELRALVKNDDKIFDFLQESSLDGLWYWDLTNPEEEWMNDTFWERLGYDPKKMPPKSSAWMGIINPYDLEIAKQKIKEHIEHPDRPYDQITRYTHAEGHTVWIRCRGMIMRDEDGAPIRMLGAHTDVSAAKHNEKILERCNTVANIGYWEVNFKKGQASFSNMTNTILGVPHKSAPDPTGPVAYFKEGEDRTKVKKAFSDAINLKAEQKAEALISTDKGDEKWCEILIIPEFQAGKCAKLFGTLRDIDVRVKASMRIEELFKKTEVQNGRLTNFAHSISHNLRSQVGALNSFVELLELDNSSIAEDELFKYLKMASEKLSETVVQLSGIAFGDEFSEEDYKSINLKSVTDSSLKAITHFDELSSIEIKNQIPEDLRVDAVEGYLESILHNLISNAIKYRDPEKEPYVIINAGNKDEQSIWFAVEDNGLGLDLNKYRSELFGLHTTFHKQEDSSGVGLFVTKYQILAMNGDIEVESEPGVGSSFKVILPIRKKTSAIPTQPATIC